MITVLTNMTVVIILQYVNYQANTLYTSNLHHVIVQLKFNQNKAPSMSPNFLSIELLYPSPLLVVLVVKNPAANAGRSKRPRFDPWLRNIPWSRKWQPTPVFLLRESHGQRSLVGYSPWGGEVSETTEWLTLNLRCTTWKLIQCRACVLSHFSRVWLFETEWTVAPQAPLPMGFSR